MNEPMQIQELRLFLEVAELGSFTKAAAQRQTVQSHISRQISELEKSCGAPLFRRTGRGVVLTEFGETVAQRARSWIQDSEELFATIRQTAKVPMGEVKIGVLPSAAHPLMTQVFTRLQAEYPRIRLNLREGQGNELDALLDTGSVDLAILFRYKRPTGQDEALLSTAQTFLVSAPGLALTQAPTVEFRRLQDLPLVLPRRPSHWRSVLDDAARGKGFNLTPAIEADSLRLQKEVLLANPNLCALLGPFSISDELRQGRLQAARLVQPDLRRYVTLARARHGHFTQAARVVSQLIRETAASWKGQIFPTAL